MTEKRFEYNHEKGYKDYIYDVDDNRMMWGLDCICELLNQLNDENEQLKKGMIEVVDMYIRNVEHNPPSSTRTYLKVKGALNNVREGLRDLLEDLK